MELFDRPQDLQQHELVFNVFGDGTQGYRNHYMIEVAEEDIGMTEGDEYEEEKHKDLSMLQ